MHVYRLACHAYRNKVYVFYLPILGNLMNDTHSHSLTFSRYIKVVINPAAKDY